MAHGLLYIKSLVLPRTIEVVSCRCRGRLIPPVSSTFIDLFLQEIFLFHTMVPGEMLLELLAIVKVLPWTS